MNDSAKNKFPNKKNFKTSKRTLNTIPIIPNLTDNKRKKAKLKNIIESLWTSIRLYKDSGFVITCNT